MRNAFACALAAVLVFALMLGIACTSKSSEPKPPPIPTADAIEQATAESSGSSETEDTSIPPPTEATAEPERAGFYRNTTYGFSISYPPEWIKDEINTSGLLASFHDPDDTCLIQLFIEYLPEIMTSKDYATLIIDTLEQSLSDFQVLSAGDIDLGGKPGFRHQFTGVESGIRIKAELVSLVRKSHALVIMATSPEPLFDEQKDIIDEIISSFRLEEPKPFGVPRDGSLTLFDTGPRTLDPALLRDATSASYALEVFSGLVTLNQDLQVIPDIAEKWKISTDGKTYTFQLRKGVHFHNGKEVKADDFKYSIERACDPATGSQTAANYLGDIVGVKEKLSGKAAQVSGVKVVDDHTLQLTIDAPKAYFLAKLVHPVSFVTDRENVESGEEWWQTPNGTGPFTIKDWKPDELLILERNDLYYRELPSIKNAVFRLWGGVPMIMYETGEIDIAYASAFDIERVLDPANPLNKELITTPEFSLWYLVFNSDTEPFDDIMVRKAFSHAVDKDKIIRLVLKDMVKRADGILPPGMPGYNEKLKGLEFNPEKAKELLRESKYGSVAHLPPITFTTSGRGEISPINEALIDMWRQVLGVEVSIRQLEPEKYPYVIDAEKDELCDVGWIADYPDPQNFLDSLFHTDSRDNTGEYSNPAIDALLEAAREEMDTNVRLSMYQEIEQLLVDDAACLPLFFSVNYTLVKPYVKGFVPSPMPISWLKYISIQQED